MKIVVTIDGGCLQDVFAEDPDSIQVIMADYDNLRSGHPDGSRPCQHSSGEDCMDCIECGNCDETLNDDNICSECMENPHWFGLTEVYPMAECDERILGRINAIS